MIEAPFGRAMTVIFMMFRHVAFVQMPRLCRQKPSTTDAESSRHTASSESRQATAQRSADKHCHVQKRTMPQAITRVFVECEIYARNPEPLADRPCHSKSRISTYHGKLFYISWFTSYKRLGVCLQNRLHILMTLFSSL